MDLYAPWAALACTAAVLVVVSTPAFASADAPPNDDRERLPSLDGLRGLAAFGVFLHHALITHEWLTDGVWRLPPSRFFSMVGQVAVAVFFMITGFLFWSIVIRERGRPRWVALYVGRIFRIGPVYALAIGIVAVVVFWRAGMTVRIPASDLVRESLRWLSLGMFPDGSLNGDATAGRLLAGVTWTLQYEWWFYAALPLLALGARRPKPVLPFTAALVVLSLAWWGRGGPVWNGPLDPVFALLFACGMGSAAARAAGLIPRVAPAILSAGALAVVAAVFVLFPSAYGVLPACALACGFFLVIAGGDVFGLLNSRAARRLGDVSFGIYLLQGPVLALAFADGAIRRAALGDARIYWLVVLGAGLLLAGVAAAAHRWVERPGIRAGKALVARLSRLSRVRPRAGSPQRASPPAS